MRSVLVATLTAASAVAVIASSPAQAGDYPYCLQGQEWGYPGNCQFLSQNECKAAASGTSADCGLNPRVAFGVEPPYFGDYAGMRPAFDAQAYTADDDRRGGR
jgi:hypothetical protein